MGVVGPHEAVCPHIRIRGYGASETITGSTVAYHKTGTPLVKPLHHITPRIAESTVEYLVTSSIHRDIYIRQIVILRNIVVFYIPQRRRKRNQTP